MQTCLYPYSLSFLPSCCNNHQPIILVLSDNCEQILMSPQFYSALAASACCLPASKDTQVAIIPSLLPPWMITVLFSLIPPSFSQLSCYFRIFSASIKVHSQTVFFFLYFVISLLFVPFSSSPSLAAAIHYIHRLPFFPRRA